MSASTHLIVERQTIPTSTYDDPWAPQRTPKSIGERLGLSQGARIGIGIGGLALLIFIVVALFLYFCRRKIWPRRYNNQNNYNDNANPTNNPVYFPMNQQQQQQQPLYPTPPTPAPPYTYPSPPPPPQNYVELGGSGTQIEQGNKNWQQQQPQQQQQQQQQYHQYQQQQQQHQQRPVGVELDASQSPAAASGISSQHGNQYYGYNNNASPVSAATPPQHRNSSVSPIIPYELDASNPAAVAFHASRGQIQTTRRLQSENMSGNGYD